jgi:perosamine synthetase
MKIWTTENTFNGSIKHTKTVIPIYKPYLSSKTLDYAKDALDSTWISSHGKYLNLLKNELKEVNQSKYVVLTNTGTSAVHLMALGLQYKHPNVTNLLVPSNVYIAAWNAFKMSTDYNFISLDSNIETWNANYYGHLKANKHDKTDTAILVVHNIGNIVNVPKLKEDFPGYIILEDNCEGFLGRYDNKPTGSGSWVSAVSFFGNKTITSGEGGALFTDDECVYNYLNSVRSQGSTNNKFKFNKMGYNYRMTNIQASLLYGQLQEISHITHLKERVTDLYKQKLKSIDCIEFQEIEPGTKHSNWMVGVRFHGFGKNMVNELVLHLYQNDIETRPMFPVITDHDHYSDIEGEFPQSQLLHNSALILPSFPEILEEEITYICNCIKEYLEVYHI